MIKAADILKNRCANATATAAGLPVDRAASMAVMVVPMLAPIVNGNSCSSFTIPAPTSGTIADVVMELLCTITVMPVPAATAAQGERNKVRCKTCSARSDITTLRKSTRSLRLSISMLTPTISVNIPELPNNVPERNSEVGCTTARSGSNRSTPPTPSINLVMICELSAR